MAAVLGVTATIWLVDGVNNLFKDSNEFIFLLIAGIIFIWFALISYLLIKFFVKAAFISFHWQLVLGLLAWHLQLLRWCFGRLFL